MATGCINGRLDETKKRWIPCRLFSLNSVTLTLLSICPKLPVDLTTSMPSIQDQLSKLSGTTIICISMGFFNPSIGENRESESFTNMASLSILVITITVNICIQMYTGVIYLFKIEHIVIMSCMLVLLVFLWWSALATNSLKGLSLDSSKSFITKGEGSMLQRLRLCYLYGFNSNPQLIICRVDTHETISGLCLICFGVLIQATIRSLILKNFWFCGGNSDYDWSIWIIIMTQILTVIIIFSATSFRWLTLFARVERPMRYEVDTSVLILYNPILGARLWDRCELLVKVVAAHVMFLPWLLFTTLSHLLLPSHFFSHSYEDEGGIQEYKHLIDEKELSGWIVWKAVNDMNRWMEVSRSKSPNNLSHFIKRKSPSQQFCSMESTDLMYPDAEGIEVSSFAMTILTRIASSCIPHLSTSLDPTFGEAYEIVDFIEAKTSTVSLKITMKSKLTKALLIGKGFGALLPKIIERYGEEFHSQSELICALVIIKELKNVMESDFVSKEVSAITYLINPRHYETIEDLYNHIEEIFADMLHLFLYQFPNAIFKYVTESPAEEFEERVRLSLELLCKIELLEAQVQWSFPVGSSFSSLVTPQNP